MLLEAETDTGVSITDEDKIPQDSSHVFAAEYDTGLNDIVRGDWTTTLKVYFKGSYTVTYKNEYDGYKFSYTWIGYWEETPFDYLQVLR